MTELTLENAFSNDAAQSANRIGAAKVSIAPGKVELRLPGDLGWGKALVGFVPILWCAAAWMMCLREHLLHQRLQGCLTLSAIALLSVILMLASTGPVWKFHQSRRRFTKRTGLFQKSHNARRYAGLRIETTKPGKIADVYLKLIVVDATNHEALEIARWNRRETDRTQVDDLAATLSKMMAWQ